jgi:hypothetical protein
MARFAESLRTEVRERLKRVHLDYALYMNCVEAEGSSIGMTAGYGAVNTGKTNRKSDHTAILALRAANMTAEARRRLQWVDCVWRVFNACMTSYPASRSARLRDRTIGYILYHHVLLGWTFAKLAESQLPTGSVVSRQRIQQLYEKALDMVLREAVRQGIIRRQQA